MLVYAENFSQFLSDASSGQIDTIVNARVNDRLNIQVGESELASWGNSLSRVALALSRSTIPDDAGVSIECQLPMTSKRIDFILSGYDENGKSRVVIVELKQWSEAEISPHDGLVRTWLGGRIRETSHPSYQAWSYAKYLEGFNEVVEKENIDLLPCAYLHNCTDTGTLSDQRYSTYTSEAPLFFKEDTVKLKEFLEKYVKKGDCGKLMYSIDHGKIRPSKSLADSLAAMLNKQKEFIMIDEQKVVYELGMSAIRKSSVSQSGKQVIVVRGGPGTGKSVVAINLLVEALGEEFNALYVTKNSAPRAVYESKLTGVLTRSAYSSLFKGSGGFTTSETDGFDAILVDEAHRLNEKSGLYSNLGENQIKELINAAKCTVFFLDEDQRIHIKDIGSEEEIKRYALQAGAEVLCLDLPSQFRCNGSDGYIAWLDNYLGIRETEIADLKDVDYDFRIASSLTELDSWIRNKNEENGKSRIVAGYCWDWVSKREYEAFDFDFPEENFQRKWNLSEDGGLWIMKPDSIDQIGCIHTCQGLECDYIGVIIGPDLRINLDGSVTTHPEKRSKNDYSIRGWKTRMRENPEQTTAQLDAIIKNTYRTLMTRGMKGCYVYFVP